MYPVLVVASDGSFETVFLFGRVPQRDEIVMVPDFSGAWTEFVVTRVTLFGFSQDELASHLAMVVVVPAGFSKKAAAPRKAAAGAPRKKPARRQKDKN